jgi:hypothetical protein
VGHLGKEARLMNSIAFIRGRTVKNHHAWPSTCQLGLFGGLTSKRQTRETNL